MADPCGIQLPDWLGAMFEGLDDDPDTRRLVACSLAAETCARLQAALQSAEPASRPEDAALSATLDQLRANWTAYTDENAKIVKLARSGDASARTLFQGEALDQFYGMEDNVLAMIDQDSKAAADVSNRSAQIYAAARRVLTGAIVGGLAAAIALMAIGRKMIDLNVFSRFGPMRSARVATPRPMTISGIAST